MKQLWSAHIMCHISLELSYLIQLHPLGLKLTLEGNLTKIPTCEKQKIEKTHVKEEQSHAQDSIY